MDKLHCSSFLKSKLLALESDTANMSVLAVSVLSVEFTIYIIYSRNYAAVICCVCWVQEVSAGCSFILQMWEWFQSFLWTLIKQENK